MLKEKAIGVTFYRVQYETLKAKVEATLKSAGFQPYQRATVRQESRPGYFILPRDSGRALGVYHRIEENIIHPEIATSLVNENEKWIDQYYELLDRQYTVYGEIATTEISHCFLHVEP